MDTFNRYAPFIQDYIYQSGWTMLRGVQNAAGEAIFNSDSNVLLMASTASGKTEAAFFPVLTLLDEDPPSSVGALYIAPLKALINDQFTRIDEVCQDADIRVTKWHGDASQSAKRKLLKNPSGVVQITPESLESLMINKHMAIPSLFHDLRFIIVDELHSFLRGDRGLQTFCLIERLCQAAGCNPRRIGLSATIGDPVAAAKFLSAGSDRNTVIPRFDPGKEVWRISMEHFYEATPPLASDHQVSDAKRQNRTEISDATLTYPQLPKDAGNADAGSTPRPDDGALDAEILRDTDSPQQEKPTDVAPAGADPWLAYIFEHTRGRKCLIFTNSREECEAVCQTLRQYCDQKHEPDRFLIHHGNLSASYRESAEEEMKDDESLMSICATATLELGIDIGRLERAFQIEAPFTVSGFLQRLGRTGRRGTPSEMRFVMRESIPQSRAMLPELIPWSLVQGIALVQLYVEDRFVEPPRTDRLPYSLLYHQTMSTLASCGEMTPAELASRILTLTCFQGVTQKDYQILLRHLVDIDHIQKTENGGLIVGIDGERIVNNYKFYAVFQENLEYAVRAGSEELGTIVAPPPVGSKIAIAGRVWIVDEVDVRRHVVYCTGVRGNIPAYFGETPGDIHTRVLERMRGVLSEERVYPYLMKNARARLAVARENFSMADLSRHPLINLGGNTWALFPWLGTYSFMTLERFLTIHCAPRLGLRNMNSHKPYYLQFTMEAGPQEFFQVLAEEAAKEFSPVTLLYPREVPVFEKYDEFVAPELVRKGFAYGVLDVRGMKQRIYEWAVTQGVQNFGRSRIAR